MVEDDTTAPTRTSAESPLPESWDIVIRPQRHLLDLNLREIWQYRDLLYMFVMRDIVTVYKQTVLGPIWFVLQPIMTTLVFLFVFGNIAQLSTDGTPGLPFYMAGVVLWNYFSESFNKTATTFTANAQIFGRVYFPRLITPLSIVVSGLIKFLIQYLMFIVFVVYYAVTTDAIHPQIWVLFTPVIVLLMAGYSLGFGIIFSSLTTKYRDLTFLIQFGVQLLMYASAVIYPISMASGRVREVLLWNPFVHIIEAFKYAYLGKGLLTLSGMIYTTLFMVGVLIVGVIIFNRTERNFMDTV